MIEVAVAIGVIAILAGAVAPLALKALNQQREQKTRDNLKIAWESLFGARDRRVANMRADFGFTPAAGNYNLGKMLARNNAPTPNPPNYGLNGGIFNWGWNGPYWTGSTRTIGGALVPVDAWGNTIQLRYVSGGPYRGFQLLSTGPNGISNSAANNYRPQGDDLAYPDLPQLLTATASSLNISIKNNRATNITGTYRVRWRDGGPNLAGAPAALPVIAAGPAFTLPVISNVPPGPIQVQIDIISPPALNSMEVVDLLPGESRTLNYNIY